jgi:cyanate permease
VAALVLVLVGAGGLLYAPDNKTVIKVVILVVGVLIGLGGWLWARIPRR